MRNNLSKVLSLTALFTLFGGMFYQPLSLSGEKSVTVHIFYSSDFNGYHEGCG
jgi:hypothetical protein